MKQALEAVSHPEHVSGVVSVLAGPDGAWTTGQVIDASGGTKLLSTLLPPPMIRSL